MSRNQSHRHAENVKNKAGITPMAAAFSSFTNGTGQHGISRIPTDFGVVPPSRSPFYIAQHRIERVVEDLRKKSVKKAREKLEPGATISIDVAWNTRGHGNYSILEAMYEWKGMNSIVFCDILRRDIPGLRGNFHGPSGNMEGASVRHLVKWLKTLPKGLVVGYVHDNDATTRKIILESGLGLVEYLDPGHARKSIAKSINTANTR
jgi:hypothetical protein